MARDYPPKAPEGSRCAKCRGTGRVPNHAFLQSHPHWCGDATDYCPDCWGSGWSRRGLDAEVEEMVQGLTRAKALDAGAAD